MDIFQTFEEYLAQSSTHIPVIWFIINLLLTGIMALILKEVYTRYGSTLSNRKLFGKNFLMISMTTMIIITVVKSSLALSLGLVGALSIIRFRSAIKEPEELAYVFLSISIGLGFGANQGIITILGLLIILSIIVLTKRLTSGESENNNLHLTIMSQDPKESLLNNIVETLKKHCSLVNIKRLDDSDKVIEVTFLVELKNFDKLNIIKKELRDIDNEINITFLDKQGLI